MSRWQHLREFVARQWVLDFFCLLVLAVLALVAHWKLYIHGLALLHADYAPSLVVAHEFSEGEFSIFAFGMSYAGTTLTALRGLWELLLRSVLGMEKAQMIFTYGVYPVALSWASYFLTRGLFRRVPALFSAAFIAVGFAMLDSHLGNDPYVFFVLFGMLTLGLRCRLKKPVFEYSSGHIFFLGFASGLALYTSRICLFYLFAFFFDYRVALELLRKAWRTQGRVQSLLRAGIIFFLVLFFYLELFGADLGTFRGRAVKLHASPNLWFAIALLVVLARGEILSWLDRSHLQKGFVFLLGGIVGFIPELVHVLKTAQLTSGTPKLGNAQWPELLEAVGLLPERFRSIIVSNGDLEAQGILLLVLTGLIGVFLDRGALRLRSVRYLLAIVCFAFVRYRTYSPADARYLIPLYPVVAVAIAWTFHTALQIRRRAWRGVGVAALSGALLLHVLLQSKTNEEIGRRVESSGSLKHAYQVIEAFRDASVTLVFSSDYWHGNQYLYLAHLNPIFMAVPVASLVYPKALPASVLATRAGYLVGPADVVGSEVVLQSRRWRSKFLATVGDRRLYVLEESSRGAQ